MQAQTTGKHLSGSRKVMGGLVIATALAAGAVGVTTVGDLEFPRFGSDASSARPVVHDTHVGSWHGEGLPLSVEQPGPAPQIAISPPGEGFPMNVSEQSKPAGSQRMDFGQQESFPRPRIRDSLSATDS